MAAIAIPHGSQQSTPAAAVVTPPTGVPPLGVHVPFMLTEFSFTLSMPPGATHAVLDDALPPPVQSSLS